MATAYTKLPDTNLDTNEEVDTNGCTPSLLSEQTVKCCCRITLHIWQDMAVGIQRHADGGVP